MEQASTLAAGWREKIVHAQVFFSHVLSFSTVFLGINSDLPNRRWCSIRVLRGGGRGIFGVLEPQSLNIKFPREPVTHRA